MEQNLSTAVDFCHFSRQCLIHAERVKQFKAADRTTLIQRSNPTMLVQPPLVGAGVLDCCRVDATAQAFVAGDCDGQTLLSDSGCRSGRRARQGFN